MSDHVHTGAAPRATTLANGDRLLDAWDATTYRIPGHVLIPFGRPPRASREGLILASAAALAILRGEPVSPADHVLQRLTIVRGARAYAEAIDRWPHQAIVGISAWDARLLSYVPSGWSVELPADWAAIGAPRDR